MFKLIACFAALLLYTQNVTMISTKTSLYDIEIKDIYGDKLDLSKFKGKKIIFVNVASECGYTSQYEQLEKVHKMYGDKVEVIGCPSNDFGGQEPGTAQEIVTFCSTKFGADFLLTEKLGIKENTHTLYQWLTDKEFNGKMDETVTWNFCKFLINEDGTLETFYNSKVLPDDERIIIWIKS